MFRITLRTASNSTVFVLEGTLSGLWSKELLRASREHEVGSGVIFDIQRLSHLDSAGEEVLKILNRRGGKFIVASLYGRDLCKRLGLTQAVSSENAKLEGKRLGFQRRRKDRRTEAASVAVLAAGKESAEIRDTRKADVRNGKFCSTDRIRERLGHTCTAPSIDQ